MPRLSRPHAARVFFLLLFFSAIACVPYTMFEDGREYMFFQEDADIAFHYLASLPGDEGAVEALDIVGDLSVQRTHLFLDRAQTLLFAVRFDHPPKKHAHLLRLILSLNTT